MATHSASTSLTLSTSVSPLGKLNVKGVAALSCTALLRTDYRISLEKGIFKNRRWTLQRCMKPTNKIFAPD